MEGGRPRWMRFVLYFAVSLAGLTLLQFLGLLGTTPAGHPPAFGALAEGGVCALAIVCLLTFLSRRTGVSRRREQAVLGLARYEDRRALDRAARRGEPPADPSRDRPLLTLVRHRRADLRGARPFRWLIGVSLVLLGAGVALDPEVRQITTSGVSVVIGVGLLAHYSLTARRLARVEESLRLRLSRESGPRPRHPSPPDVP